jgi:Flp pilus assembly pilin Flp
MTKKATKRQRGYTLLEYCAGAAIIAGVLWAALGRLGGDISDLLDGIGQWAQDRRGEIGQGGGGTNP